MTEALVVTSDRGRLVNSAQPQWVMLGLSWDGPGVLMLASRTLTAAELDFRARSYEFRDWSLFLASFRPELTLSVHMHDDYVLVAGATYADCLAELLKTWSPDDPAGRRSTRMISDMPVETKEPPANRFESAKESFETAADAYSAAMARAQTAPGRTVDVMTVPPAGTATNAVPEQ